MSLAVPLMLIVLLTVPLCVENETAGGFLSSCMENSVTAVGAFVARSVSCTYTVFVPLVALPNADAMLAAGMVTAHMPLPADVSVAAIVPVPAKFLLPTSTFTAVVPLTCMVPFVSSGVIYAVMSLLPFERTDESTAASLPVPSLTELTAGASMSQQMIFVSLFSVVCPALSFARTLI